MKKCIKKITNRTYGLNFFYIDLTTSPCYTNYVAMLQFLEGCKKTCMTVSDNTDKAKNNSTIRHAEHANGSDSCGCTIGKIHNKEVRLSLLYIIEAFHKYIAGYIYIKKLPLYNQRTLTYSEWSHNLTNQILILFFGRAVAHEINPWQGWLKVNFCLKRNMSSVIA